MASATPAFALDQLVQVKYGDFSSTRALARVRGAYGYIRYIEGTNVLVEIINVRFNNPFMVELKTRDLYSHTTPRYVVSEKMPPFSLGQEVKCLNGHFMDECVNRNLGAIYCDRCNNYIAVGKTYVSCFECDSNNFCSLCYNFKKNWKPVEFKSGDYVKLALDIKKPDNYYGLLNNVWDILLTKGSRIESVNKDWKTVNVVADREANIPFEWLRLDE